MKRDMDLVRRIALEVADMDFGYVIDGMEDEGVDAATFGLHVIWMQEAGLIKAFVQEYQSGEPPKARISRLTWAGCEFVDAIRDDTMWAKAKANVLKPGMSFTFDVLKDWLKTEITQGLPTLRALGQ
ncbi:DUF2513 domain-containing protein [Acidovorax sp. NCPPB 4044]|uniref:DUF2513 domain-containing protein n=1 Tax=Acidovorax sp. NCPPB 4044 TaxID=2940490 RepID=UPI002302BB8A|nr:DUF2513 domain-containing protein [Acidovorax sp. NCPPB 4044]MDA8522007.1 DUF2513 domain-containing protein [Acidovorax sp. NCPPB 4044]